MAASTIFSRELAARVIAHLQAEALDRRHSAGMNGSWGDGGASELLAVIDAFEAGQNNRWPNGWENAAKTMEQSNDAEYAEYLRLREKFKDVP